MKIHFQGYTYIGADPEIKVGRGGGGNFMRRAGGLVRYQSFILLSD